jgi:hypothetical protein
MSQEKFSRERTQRELGKLIGTAGTGSAFLNVVSSLAIQLRSFGELTEDERAHLQNISAALDHAAKGIRHVSRRARRLDDPALGEIEPFNPETEPKFPTE